MSVTPRQKWKLKPAFHSHTKRFSTEETHIWKYLAELFIDHILNVKLPTLTINFFTIKKVQNFHLLIGLLFLISYTDLAISDGECGKAGEWIFSSMSHNCPAILLIFHLYLVQNSWGFLPWKQGGLSTWPLTKVCISNFQAFGVSHRN